MAGVGLRASRLIGALLVAACAGSVPTQAPRVDSGRVIVPLAGDPGVHALAVAERARGAEVVYLGEVHDNPSHHAIQVRVLEMMLAGGARPVLVFEMLAEGQQEELEGAITSADTAAEVERRLRWRARGWPDFAMYWPLFTLARRHRLPVVAADLDPVVARQIARAGLATLGAEGVRLASRLPSGPARDAAIGRRLQAAHCDLLDESRLPRMVEGWHARNVTIARRLAEALGRVTPIVVIIGRGHQEDGGVPAQLEALRPGTRQLVVEMLEVGAGETADTVARRGTGDVIWLTPAVERADPCADLRQRLGGDPGRRRPLRRGGGRETGGRWRTPLPAALASGIIPPSASIAVDFAPRTQGEGSA